MEKLKINTRTLSKISLVINKMGISTLLLDLNVDTGNEKQDQEVLVKKLLSLIIDNLYKAEDEIIELISQVKNIPQEEAENEDVIAFVKDLLQIDKLKDFLNLS